jgi:hypothetical protein
VGLSVSVQELGGGLQYATVHFNCVKSVRVSADKLDSWY